MGLKMGIMKCSTGKILLNKKAKKLCEAHGCNCKKEKRIKGYHRFCRRHRFYRDRESNPVYYVYQNLRSSAKRRGKIFTISFEYFKNWCEEVGFMNHKRGLFKNRSSVDRIDNNLGYIEGNLKMLSVSQNSRKQFVPYFANGGG